MESLSLTKERTATRELEWTLSFLSLTLLHSFVFASFLNFIFNNLVRKSDCGLEMPTGGSISFDDNPQHHKVQGSGKSHNKCDHVAPMEFNVIVTTTSPRLPMLKMRSGLWVWTGALGITLVCHPCPSLGWRSAPQPGPRPPYSRLQSGV